VSPGNAVIAMCGSIACKRRRATLRLSYADVAGARGHQPVEFGRLDGVVVQHDDAPEAEIGQVEQNLRAATTVRIEGSGLWTVLGNRTNSIPAHRLHAMKRPGA
jgi:hypothetical protein